MAAQTYLCYGIAVTNESLTYATMAYEKLDGPLRFIQLVQNRLRQGRLQARDRQTVTYVPIEVWDLVRHKVVDLELRTAERKLVDEYTCDECSYEDSAFERPETWSDLTKCPAYNERYSGFQSPQLKEKYQLDMPSTEVLHSIEPRFATVPQSDPDSIAFIALPSSPITEIDDKDHPSYKEPRITTTEQYHNDGIWNISLELPSRADERFRRLLRDLHLQPVQVDDGTIGLARATGSTRKRSYKKISAGEAKPRWQLFTTVVCDW
ncbi:hypothetical protein JCM10908_003028 [Rhodotorula pacifica]|uniref:uncharacterized protein n=1 Tax=Rhodotorula pacifica TaxID=1495444 RepID=UPI00316FC714